MGLLVVKRLSKYTYEFKIKRYNNTKNVFKESSKYIKMNVLKKMGPDEKSSQGYPVNSGILQGSILGSIIFLIYVNDLYDNFMCIIAIYVLLDFWFDNSFTWPLKLNLEFKILRIGEGSSLLISVLGKLSLCVCSVYVLYYSPPEGVGRGLSSLNQKLTKLTLRIGCCPIIYHYEGNQP